MSTGVFLLLHAYAFLKYLQSFMTKSEFRQVFVFAIAGAAGVVFLGVVGLTYLGEPHSTYTLISGMDTTSQTPHKLCTHAPRSCSVY